MSISSSTEGATLRSSSVDNSQPCIYPICLIPNPMLSLLPAELPVPLSYVTTPTSACSGYSEAPGSRVVIDFCDRRQAISGPTAHIHYENMDKHVKTNIKHRHIIWNSGCTSVMHLVTWLKRQRGKLAASSLNKGEAWLMHAIKRFIKFTLLHYISRQSVIL